MIDTHYQHDPILVSNSPLQKDTTYSSTANPTVLSARRPTLSSDRRFFFHIVPAVWPPTFPTSPRAGIRDLCLPRQEPCPPANVLNRSYLGSCSPSVAKFSRTIISRHVSASTSRTTLPLVTIHTGTSLHPATAYHTVHTRRWHHHHHYAHPNCRHAR